MSFDKYTESQCDAIIVDQWFYQLSLLENQIKDYIDHLLNKDPQIICETK